MTVFSHVRLSKFSIHLCSFYMDYVYYIFLCLFQFVYFYVLSMYTFFFVFCLYYVYNQSISFFYDFGVRLVYKFLVFVFPIILVSLCRYMSMSSVIEYCLCIYAFLYVFYFSSVFFFFIFQIYYQCLYYICLFVSMCVCANV